MTGMIAQLLAWPTLGIALLVFGFAPGVVLRLIVLFYPRGHPRRRELLGELYAVPRIERPFWVAEQLEVALFEGLRDRARAWFRRRRAPKEVDEQARKYDASHKAVTPSTLHDSHRRLSADGASRGWRGTLEVPLESWPRTIRLCVMIVVMGTLGVLAVRLGFRFWL